MNAEFRPDPDGDDLPPPPEKPDPMDCCGGGCVPCIYDLYEEELIEWEKEVAEIRARRADAPENRSSHQGDEQNHEQHHQRQGD